MSKENCNRSGVHELNEELKCHAEQEIFDGLNNSKDLVASVVYSARTYHEQEKNSVQCGARTHDREIKSLMLYRLS